ncbi:hypothetical protein SL054_002241 [Flavobacterium psychrophilum]|uniref:hypothetical protein n=1 Tax=Flavobacterium psychrophilum TaxID=96345 RepID=UPI001C8F6480|nr:hypothetical protein [Flavobacterium psychrophilum]EKT4499561.1 hypothetical protein [Flavobacterium psychrophilum]EKT4519251.1 hypothetical protein [Flavobacterium psychrophilum]ELM3650763.1 hypothetical protein [Flavobacterium psychrophilum]ELM3672042.1 hypothetical protein [Flavobacterium psychrophilum]ELM3725921.1 hypothetical protein [Flavobacterium psychrophilum]
MEKFDKTNPYNPNVKNQDPKKAIITFLVFVVVAVFFVIKCSCSEEESKIKTYDKIEALTHAQIYIKSKLKSPATAEFEGGADGVTKVNDTTFTVIGTVDSQNSFGAMLRSNYSCKIIFHPKTETHDIVDAVIQ